MQAQKSEASRLPFQPETMQRSKPTATRKKPSLWKEGPGGWWRRLAGGVVALGLAVAVYVLYNKNNQPQSNAEGNQVSYVQRQPLDGRSYREIAESRVPLILTDTVADRWLARTKFTTSFLSQRLPTVMSHRQEQKRSFMTFHDSKPLEPIVNERWEDFNVKVNTTIPQVLHWGSPADPREGPFLYFSQEVSSLRTSFPDITGYIQPIRELILSEDNVQVNLWIGREGLITHTHYDCTFNFFVQLQGRKRFTLFPPTQTLYLYPCLHPHYGHSQVDILEPDLEKFPLYSKAGAIVAEVGAGDMLVVPPFWFHHVETLSESVSVNVWSDAPEYALINHIYSLPVPFESEWGHDELLKATKIYIDMVLVASGVSDPVKFIHDLLEQRYAPVVRSGNLNVNVSLVEELRHKCLQFSWEDTRLKYEPILQRGVDNLAPLFLQIPNRATLEICLANFIEHLSYSILGLDSVFPFLQSCASF